MSIDERPSLAERQEQYSQWAQRLRRRTDEARQLDAEEPETSSLSDEWSTDRLFAATEDIVDR